MIKEILFLTLLSTLGHGQTGREFRFDYRYNKRAGGWMKLHRVPATWREARLRCHTEGGILASPLTHELTSAIIEHVTQAMGNAAAIFTGIHASFSKGDYSSIEGVPLSKLPITWAVGEPDNYGNSESCLVMLTQANGTLGDVPCDNVFPYVCYKKKAALIITGCGTHDTEYNLDTRTGSCYKFHRRGLPWSRAYMTCAGEGGHLAIINSQTEAQVLKEVYAKNPDNVIFSKIPGTSYIGFHDWGERGSWMTIHGQTLKEAGYDRFENGQPDNSTRPRTGDTGEFCGSMFRSGNLNDAWCNEIMPFICEKNPNSLLAEIDDSN